MSKLHIALRGPPERVQQKPTKVGCLNLHTLSRISLMNFNGAEIAEGDWLSRAAAQASTFVDLHPDDLLRLVEDLRVSWPALSPEDAVTFYFRPLRQRSGATELG